MDRQHEEYSWFFRTEFTGVVRTVYLILHDRQRAEDAAQDAFAQLFVHWSKVSAYDRPDAWVRRVAIRRAVKMLSRDRIRHVLERQEERTVPGPATIDPGLIDALRSLPPQQRAAIALFYLEDRPTSEVAQMLGCSESTAKVHLHRARQRLAQTLGKEWIDVDA
ncbi:MAG TPA: sigma-70 family RNA polymerase sigma factor [Actinomycetota bacterium]|nr:sigma-70 family RNA polymerase sigma factor [Actinomycetota bacterium]